MVQWKDEFKQAGLELGYDLMLVAVIISWVAAIILVILEISLWYVFGFFFLGCIFLYSMFYYSKSINEKEKEELAATEVETEKNTIEVKE
ncbi:MAG: hypothetical protein EAX90_12365 [Candidatus Heimdallarchaeota archaeon]|nr:hypothetical protein [Candidatus Heimdallarchaeota archaeon]